ncbi:MAG: SDR family NAD(P)-dependent oxidoreductase [Planctomycetota bacterium]
MRQNSQTSSRLKAELRRETPTVAVTGCAGFIGSHLVDYFLARDWRVRGIDDLSSGSRDNLRHALEHPCFEFMEGDCSRSENADWLCKGAAAVFHLAARVGVGRVIESPLKTIETNLSCTRAVAESALRHGTVMVFASTSEVYGRNENVPFSEDDDLSIGPPSVGRWAYAASKVLDEHYLLALSREKGLKVTIARPFNTIGPRQSYSQGMVLPSFIRAALSNGELVVHGRGEQRRCFTWVGDTVEALAALCCVESSRGKVFNIGSTEEISIAELAAVVIDVCGGGSVRFLPYEGMGPHFADMARRVPSVDAIREAIGWQAETRLREAVERTVLWWKEISG